MRIRTIKPEFWSHEGLCSCSEFTRLLAIALLNLADDEGYFMANPSILRGALFPFLDSSKMIPGSIQDLSRVGWIEVGEDDQKRQVGRVLNFRKHQRIDKPKPSNIKPLSKFQDASKTHPRRVQDASNEEGKGREGKGTEEEWNGMDSHPAPKGVADNKRFQKPTVNEVDEYGATLTPRFSNSLKFVSHYESNGWKVGKNPMKDWRAAVRTWQANEAGFGGQFGKSSKPRNNPTLGIQEFKEIPEL